MFDYIKIHNESAAEYDKQAIKFEWYAHDLLLGLCFELIDQEDRLLDIGIGTGLSSQLFANAGIEVYGMDASKKMLSICESKNFAKELKVHDINSFPWPYKASSFKFIIACGTLQFFEDLDFIFSEVKRLLKRNGYFAFTIKCYMENKDKIKPVKIGKIYSEQSNEGVPIYMHTGRYVEFLLKNYGFKKLKKMSFLALTTPGEGDELFSAYVINKI